MIKRVYISNNQTVIPMKKLIYLLLLILLSTTVMALDPETSKQSEEVILNFDLIEKYNQAEYTQELDFRSIISNYTFEDTKLILQAYQNGSAEMEPEAIDMYLASIKEKMKESTEVQEYMAEFLTY